MPTHGKRGGQRNDHRITLNEIFWILSTAGHRRELPECDGKRGQEHKRLDRWCANGALAGSCHASAEE